LLDAIAHVYSFVFDRGKQSIRDISKTLIEKKIKFKLYPSAKCAFSSQGLHQPSDASFPFFLHQIIPDLSFFVFHFPPVYLSSVSGSEYMEGKGLLVFRAKPCPTKCSGSQA